MIYHLAKPEDWEKALRKGTYRTPSLSSEGFIHLSTQAQLMESARRFFSLEQELVVLEIAEKNVKHLLKWESAPDREELFPHIYGPIPLELIADTFMLMKNSRGEWEKV
ncbi:MAG: DUF952 domain-containing protein [Bacteroidia bacterium]|nr:DUF952 domain-containing protein [Bacteroidia bacterium]